MAEISSIQQMQDHPPMPKWHKYAFIVGIFLLINAGFLIYIFGIVSGKNKIAQDFTSAVQSVSPNAISGVIDLNGTPPSGSTLVIAARKVGSTGGFNPVVTGLTANDGSVWSYNGAQKGVAYEMQAQLVSSGVVIASSGKKVIVAPADTESFRINVPGTSSNTTVSLSGTFNLNGYIPPGSTLTVSARKVGKTNFTTIIPSTPAVDNGVWTWPNAQSGATYEVQATLNTGSYPVSQIITVSAPATGEVLTINSPLQPPAPSLITISGTINLNGVVPNNSTISLFVEQSGTQTFNTVATNISAVDGVAWSWSQATSGTSYNIQASIITNGNTTSSSQILTVAAPATGEVLTINAQTQPNAPPVNSINTACQGQSNGLWQVSIGYNLNGAIPGAQQYQLSVGSSGGGNQMVNNTVTPSNPSQTQSYTTGYLFTTGVTYYVQYAYATCVSCNTFSNPSPTIQFSCSPPGPTNTPTNTPVPTNTPAPTGAPTNTPVPSNTPVPPTNTPVPTITPSITPTS